ncbi:MAG: RNA polymerase sigma factor [Acidobacteria bacterium]|nr:RNA polymerase sigma factor [Acidobacteriota bacterium]
MTEAAAQPYRNQRVHQDVSAVAALEFDTQLMLRVREGDAASFDLLLERHRNPVIHFLYRMVQNQAVAEELAQDVFLRVYRSRATYEPTAKFTTWLFRDRGPSVEVRLLKEVRIGEIRRAIQALPPKQRAAVLMHKYEEMEYSQIACVLKCSESAVKSLLFRAYESLRARLAHMA